MLLSLFGILVSMKLTRYHHFSSGVATFPCPKANPNTARHPHLSRLSDTAAAAQ